MKFSGFHLSIFITLIFYPLNISNKNSTYTFSLRKMLLYQLDKDNHSQVMRQKATHYYRGNVCKLVLSHQHTDTVNNHQLYQLHSCMKISNKIYKNLQKLAVLRQYDCLALPCLVHTFPTQNSNCFYKRVIEEKTVLFSLFLPKLTCPIHQFNHLTQRTIPK